MTIQLLPCARPPAVRLTGGSGLNKIYFNHTYNDSDVRSVGGRKYIVTLTHPSTTQIGFSVSCLAPSVNSRTSHNGHSKKIKTLHSRQTACLIEHAFSF